MKMWNPTLLRYLCVCIYIYIKSQKCLKLYIALMYILHILHKLYQQKIQRVQLYLPLVIITISNAGLIRWPKSTSLSRSSSQRFGASSSNIVIIAMRVACDAAFRVLHPYTLLSVWNLVFNSIEPCFSRSSKRPPCFIIAICKKPTKIAWSYFCCRGHSSLVTSGLVSLL